ncbi:MAG: lyase family protein [Pseudomonadota bacterium]
MAGSVFDSALYRDLFPTGDTGRLFTDNAEIRSLMLVEGALAKVQGDLGVIPEVSAAAIHRASLELQIDPSALAGSTGQNGVSVPGLVAAFREAMQAPEHAQFLHWGATSQDIIDTGLMLRLRQVLAAQEEDIRAVLAQLATLAAKHAETPMTARTWGQHATPMSFGSLVAQWGCPLLVLARDLESLRQNTLMVSLSGAAGTSSALGTKATDTRSALADALGLQDPGRSWHTDRTPVLRIADWMVRCGIALGKMGEDLTELSMSGISEISFGGGASSTMPQKQNPVAPSSIVALARHATGQNAVLQQAGLARHQRDGAAWMCEWMALPQLALATSAALEIATRLTAWLEPHGARMARSVDDPLGLIHAEALSFALADALGRPKAQAVTKTLCKEAAATGTSLIELAVKQYPELDPAAFSANYQMGMSAQAAQQFADQVRALQV